MAKQKVGLVLSGGGGKGAYEVGVWKALEEFGITENISVISGTSVGALNAVLFAQHPLYIAEQVWKELGADDVLHINMKKITAILSAVGLLAGNTPLRALRLVGLANMLKRGVFSRNGLRRIFDEYLDMSLLSASQIKVYAACTRIIPLRADYFCINNRPKDEAVSVLLASSAIPLVFGKVNVMGSSYYDGGILDNTPVRPVYNEKCDVIITVLLNQNDLISFEDYPGTKFINIQPQEDLGGFFNGVLRFDNSEKAIQRGYEDTKKVIGPAYDLAKTQFAVGRCLQKMRLYNEEFQEYTILNKNLSNEIGASINRLEKNLNDIIKGKRQ